MKFETQFTWDFIKRSLPAGARRVLEIGCGSGELAASLLQDGVSLIAIDTDPDLIAAARGLGVLRTGNSMPSFSLAHSTTCTHWTKQCSGLPIVWLSADDSSWKTLPTKWLRKKRCAGLAM